MHITTSANRGYLLAQFPLRIRVLTACRLPDPSVVLVNGRCATRWAAKMQSAAAVVMSAASDRVAYCEGVNIGGNLTWVEIERGFWERLCPS